MSGKRFNPSNSGSHRYQARKIEHKYKYSEDLLYDDSDDSEDEEENVDIMQAAGQGSSNDIYSNNNKASTGKNKRSKKTITIAFVSLFVAIVFLIGGIALIYFGNLLGLYTYTGNEQPNVTLDDNGNVVGKVSPVAIQENYDDPEKFGELYHDDAVLNILLMGVDDFQYGDVGRTDSMMLVSIDRRHKELKITSFMRDMYVEISDGWAPNRLNVAYSLGGMDGSQDGGPQCLINTIEQNFCIDIDKYALIRYDAFENIVDSLGGVDIELTADEAGQINAYSQSSDYAVAGWNTLSGAQARYFARIRKVGNGDFQRTERQRTIFSSLINKFKSSNPVTIAQIGNSVASQVTSNLTQENIMSIIQNALTYMNYDLKQNRIPSDEMFEYESVYISGQEASVLIPDTAWNAIYANEFIYGDDFPELAATLDYYGYSTAAEMNAQ